MKQILITIAAVVLVGCGPSVDIWKAAEDGNIKAIKQHLAAGADVDAKGGWFGGTPLHYAVGEGHKKIVELLIAKGADVHEKAKDGTTPLLIATLLGHKEIAELLIAEGANVNAKDMNGLTPLHRATYQGYKEIAELLIAKGADVNAKDDIGYTPVDWAKENHPETAELLRKLGGKTGEELKAAGN